MREYCPNPTIASWILEGAPIPFSMTPPSSTLRNYPMTPAQEGFITEQVNSLLEAGTIRQVNSAHNISPLGVVPKKNGKLRMILDLRLVNKYIQTPRFTMEDIRKVRPLLQPGDWTTTIDLKDGFHHIPILLEHQTHLGMHWRGKTYVWTTRGRTKQKYKTNTNKYTTFIKTSKSIYNNFRRWRSCGSCPPRR